MSAEAVSWILYDNYSTCKDVMLTFGCIARIRSLPAMGKPSRRSQRIPKISNICEQGGNSEGAAQDVNAQYASFEYHYVYLIFCAFIVWLIIPGIGLLYGGLARRKSSLSLLFQSLMVAAVTTFQWMFWVRRKLHRSSLLEGENS